MEFYWSTRIIKTTPMMTVKMRTNIFTIFKQEQIRVVAIDIYYPLAI